ncbi:MAG TPA: nitronate monooxygenase, partial [Xanthobacteraceae bacterium]|nr:nitronate monooxygenase [Xanthobacteraceae bacterium]
LTDEQCDMILDSCRVPIVLAPLAGGPSTPELAAAVSEAGGLGFLATGYLTAADAAERIDRTRRLTGRPFGVNVFVPGSPAPAAAVEQYARTLTGVAEQAGVSLGRPVFEDDDWDAKLAVLLAEPVPVVSFTFGLPDPGIVARLREAGSEVWVTVGTAAEASTAAARGADVLVVQGAEAGGHRGGVDDEPGAAVGLLALLQIVAAQVDLPLVATGGIATGGGVAAALCAGASAAALGTAFLDSPEAATADVHRQALHAGGLLMGAIANLRPDLYAGIVAEVPFVDVVTTMSDASVPLTTLEYDEWGNPAVKREYDYMLSYSPYDNVASKNYPAMFITAAFHDSQVSYAEPAKWVAKLRANKTDTHELLLKTDMAAGHDGRSGRLGSIEQSAEIMAWLIAHARDRRLS